jgi:hypothetical protein
MRRSTGPHPERVSNLNRQASSPFGVHGQRPSTSGGRADRLRQDRHRWRTPRWGRGSTTSARTSSSPESATTRSGAQRVKLSTANMGRRGCRRGPGSLLAITVGVENRRDHRESRARTLYWCSSAVNTAAANKSAHLPTLPGPWRVAPWSEYRKGRGRRDRPTSRADLPTSV